MINSIIEIIKFAWDIPGITYKSLIVGFGLFIIITLVCIVLYIISSLYLLSYTLEIYRNGYSKDVLHLMSEYDKLEKEHEDFIQEMMDEYNHIQSNYDKLKLYPPEKLNEDEIKIIEDIKVWLEYRKETINEYDATGRASLNKTKSSIQILKDQDDEHRRKINHFIGFFKR